MKFEDIKIGDEVFVVSPAHINRGEKGTVFKLTKETISAAHGKPNEYFWIDVEFKNAIYRYGPGDLGSKMPEPDYSPFNLHNESPADFELRQTEIRKNYHKIRPGESWNEYESRTGLPAPEIRDREGLDYWADKVIKSIGECTINDFASKMTTRPNTNRSCLG